jgi:hypothetical protein
MTEMERVKIVESMFPDWIAHLADGKVIDNILKGLTFHRIAFHRCSRLGCKNVARRHRKTCTECAAKSSTLRAALGGECEKADLFKHQSDQNAGTSFAKRSHM